MSSNEYRLSTNDIRWKLKIRCLMLVLGSLLVTIIPLNTNPALQQFLLSRATHTGSLRENMELKEKTKQLKLSAV
jgi:hypothetical protein